MTEHAERAAVSQNDEALAALVNLVVVAADNKFYLGLRLSEWAAGAPSLEAAVACAAIAQEELGHARALYPMLDQLPVTDHPAPLTGEDDRRRKYCVAFAQDEFASWTDVVAALVLIDTALTTLFDALKSSSYQPLARRASRIAGDEAVHSKYAAGRLRDMAQTAQAELVKARIAELLPEMLCWFGPSEETGLNALVAEGLIACGNDALRANYLAQTAPSLIEVGLCPAEVRFDERRKQFAYEELPWDRWNSLQRRLETSVKTATKT
jgi:1,2-phenylacetyl-CoA epoxidase catalytic subunit